MEDLSKHKILYSQKEGTSGFSDEWRDVVGFEGIYKVSISGEIRSTGAGRTFKKEVLRLVPQPEPEESHIETEIECLSRRLRNNAELLINPHMYERVRMNLIEIAEQLVTIQRKNQ